MRVLVFRYMKKYLLTIKTEFQRQLTYRVDIYAYRVGNLLEIFALLAVWTIAYKNTTNVFGYSQAEMITYVLISWLFMSIIRSYGLSERIAEEIFEGKVSDFLIKPISYLRYIVIFSIGRASVSIIYAVLVQLLIILFFSEYIVFNLDWIRAIVLLLMIIVSYFINVFCSLILGMVAFWTQRITGIDYTVSTLIKFLSGVYFPIALLPESFLNFDKFFPFIYTIYMPTQLYLGKIKTLEGVYALGIEFLWLFILYGIIKLMWSRGIRRYEGVGI